MIIRLICVLFDALPEQWSSLQGKFWKKCLNPLQKIALYRGFELCIFNSHHTGDRTNWDRTNREPPVTVIITYLLPILKTLFDKIASATFLSKKVQSSYHMTYHLSTTQWTGIKYRERKLFRTKILLRHIFFAYHKIS